MHYDEKDSNLQKTGQFQLKKIISSHNLYPQAHLLHIENSYIRLQDNLYSK